LRGSGIGKGHSQGRFASDAAATFLLGEFLEAAAGQIERQRCRPINVAVHGVLQQGQLRLFGCQSLKASYNPPQGIRLIVCALQQAEAKDR
jgi:hypothetical protein